MEFVKPFLLGGSVIAGAKMVSKIAHPAFAPIIGGMPTGLIAVFFLDSSIEKRKYFSGYIYSSALLAATIFICNMAVLYTNVGANNISILGLLIWGITTYFIINNFVVNKKI
jgi:hypothetical protein